MDDEAVSEVRTGHAMSLLAWQSISPAPCPLPQSLPLTSKEPLTSYLMICSSCSFHAAYAARYAGRFFSSGAMTASFFNVAKASSWSL